MGILQSLAETVVNFMNAEPALVPTLIALPFAVFVVIAVHEFGHALAARRLLDVDVTVAVGRIGRIADLQLGRVRVELNVLTGLAGTGGSASFSAARATARDLLLIALAGPAASLVALIATIELYAQTSPGSFPRLLLWGMVLTGILAVLNVIPFRWRRRRDGPLLSSDGRLVLEALRVLYATR